MKPLGIKGTYDAIRTASGPAQHVAISLVGLTFAGMFVGMVPDLLLAAWVGSSAMVLVATVWLTRKWLKSFLLMDFVLSCMVLTFYFMHDLTPSGPMYHVMTAEGMQMANRSSHGMSMIDKFAHALACVMMAGWSLYLSNLVQRQILEAERYEIIFEGETLK